VYFWRCNHYRSDWHECIEPAGRTDRAQYLILKRSADANFPIQNQKYKTQNRPDAVMLEIFNNLFRAIAEQMGITLQNTSSSVNIKERLDFSSIRPRVSLLLMRHIFQSIW